MQWISKTTGKHGLYVFDRKAGSGATINEDLAQELHKPVIKNFKRRKT